MDLGEIKSLILQNQVFKQIIEEIQKIWDIKKEQLQYSFEIEYERGKNIKDDFPPCINEILSKVSDGQNLNHTERLYIVWFLIALKYPEEEIIKLFSTLPDFDRDKTGYQVRYAIRKGYSPYSCKSLKSFDLCMAKKSKDEICLKGYYSRTQEKQIELSRPLSYISIKQYRDAKKSKSTNNQPSNKNE
jgi:DNA primase large subunit